MSKKGNQIENYEKKAEELLKLNDELNEKNQKLKEEMFSKEKVKAEQENICNNLLDSEENEQEQEQYESNSQNKSQEDNKSELNEQELIQQIAQNINLEEQMKNQVSAQIEGAQVSLEETVRTLQEQKIIRIQQLKQTALSNEVEDLTSEIEKDDIIISEIDTEGKQITEKAKSHQQQIAQLNQKLEKTKQSTEEYKKLIISKDKANKEIQICGKQELDKLSKEQKTTEQEMNKRDLKINRLQEESDKQKLELQKYKQQHNGKFEDFESLNQRLQQENQKLERYKTELLSTFKKQLKYIDILKRQKTHLEAAYLFQYSEKEFLKALELGEKVDL